MRVNSVLFVKIVLKEKIKLYFQIEEEFKLDQVQQGPRNLLIIACVNQKGGPLDTSVCKVLKFPPFPVTTAGGKAPFCN